MRHEAKILSLAAGLWVAGSSFLMGQEPAPLAAPRPNPGIYGTQLYGKTLGADHTIEFYEFSPGQVAIRESKSADDGQPAFMAKTGQFGTLADIYVRLNPGVKRVPQSILEADERAALKRSSPPGASRIVPPLVDEPAPLRASSSSACSGDFYGDGWGATWFLNNYCNAGRFRFCDATNWGRADSGEYQVSWSSWRQMEGDFNERGHIWCEVHSHHWWGQTAKTVVVNYDVLPRHVEVWYTSDSDTVYRWIGTSTCGHLHLALLWNP